MSEWRVVITITKAFDDRETALEVCDTVMSKVPDAWEIREESVKRE